MPPQHAVWFGFWLCLVRSFLGSGQQGFHFSAQRLIAVAGIVEKGLAIGRITLQRIAEQVLDLLPTHGSAVEGRLSNLSPQAGMASVQSHKCQNKMKWDDDLVSSGHAATQLRPRDSSTALGSTLKETCESIPQLVP